MMISRVGSNPTDHTMLNYDTPPEERGGKHKHFAEKVGDRRLQYGMDYLKAMSVLKMTDEEKVYLFLQLYDELVDWNFNRDNP